MAATYYTVDSLIQSMRTRGFIPKSTGLDTGQVLQIMTEEADFYVPSFFKMIREEYLVTTKDVNVSASSGSVPAPGRAAGAAFRTVQWSNDGTNFSQLPRIEPERAIYYPVAGQGPAGYMFQGDTVKLVPQSSAGGTLRLAYMQRPGQMVLSTQCVQVQTFDLAAGTVNGTSAATSIFSSGSLVDVVKGTPNFTTRAIDLGVTGVNAQVLSFQVGSLPTDIAAGDWICPAGQTCAPPFPTEVWTLLSQRTAYVLLMAQGDAKAKAAQQLLLETEKSMREMLSPRSDGSARPIVSRFSAGVRRLMW